MNRRSLLLGVLAAVAVSACTSSVRAGSASAPQSRGITASASTGTGLLAQLTQSHPCAGIAGFVCSTLRVPLDHSGHTAGTLGLQVAAAANVKAPRGVLLFLTGGPGQPGVPFVPRITSRIGPVLKDYRLVMFDQRGTGQFGAITCTALQAAVGGSDITAPPPRSVQNCANSIGPNRRFYSTADTVADMDMLRRALGAQKMVVDGVSYGTFVAEHYALAYPTRVSRLVLDSVLPHADPGHTDALYLVGLRAIGRVLRAACQVKPVCGFDPASDVAWLVRHRGDGVQIFDMLVTYEFIDPTYRNPNPAQVPRGLGDVVGALHAARLGLPAHLAQLIQGLSEAGGSPSQFSSGLHAATLCTDMRFPWGSDAVPIPQRMPALATATAQLSTSQVWPFDAKTAADNGFVQTCLNWPVTPPAPEAAATTKLPAVPTLILAGDHDLSTPLEWAEEEAASAPRAQLVIVRGASHSIQTREPGNQGRRALYAFLLR
ncbi:MAG TPA: alpha/beta fold hydrolase [Streptosporangiaceae bacterium]|nr:alpha/beta fold hydrolase [Streptosporangiaceae bacterium]